MASRFAHWTPRYIFNRIRWGAYHRPGTRPWLSPAAVDLLSTLIRPVDVGLEWGSGRSTRWFAARLKHLTSVEDNPEWHQRVSRDLAEQNVTNVSYRLVAHPGPEDAGASAYVRVCGEFADSSLGFALVDGSAREYCTLAVMPKICAGGLLVIDNINRYLDYPTHSPASRVGKGPLNAMWADIAQKLSAWRMIWTSSGVTDTAIWIRPHDA